MHVEPNHPLQELLGKLLFGIETVPTKEQRKMVNRVCREATKWHDAKMGEMRSLLNRVATDSYLFDSDDPGCWSCGVESGSKHLDNCLFRDFV